MLSSWPPTASVLALPQATYTVDSGGQPEWPRVGSREYTCLSLAVRAPQAIRLGFITLAETGDG